MVEQKKFAEQQTFAASQQAFPTKAPLAPAPIAPVGLAQPILSNSNVISATPFQKVSEQVSVFEVSPQPIITAQSVPLAASILPQKMPIAQAIPAMPAPTTSTFVQQPMMMQQQTMQSVQPMQSIPLQQQKPISMARNIPITEKRPFTETIAPKLNIAETTKPTISEAVELVEKQMGIEKQTFHLPSSGLQAEGIDTSLPESLTNLRPIQRAEEAVSSVAATASNLATSAAETAVLATAQGVESAKNLASSVASTASDIAEGTMEVAANLGSGIAQTASNVASKTAEVASSVGSAVAAKTADVVEGAKEVVSEAVNKAPEVASAVAAKTVDIAEGTAEVVSSAAHKGAELAADVGVGVASVASRTAELAVESGILERGKEMVSAAAHASLEAAEAVVHMGASVVSAAAHMGSQLLSGAVEMMVPPVVEESEFLEKEISELSLEEADLTWVYPKIFTPAFMEAVIDISPIEFETDFRGLEFDIKALSREGLWWGRAEQVDVAFGIRRLRMVCIFDSRFWSLSALEDWFGVELRDKVQGIEFVGVNRLGKL